MENKCWSVNAEERVNNLLAARIAIEELAGLQRGELPIGAVQTVNAYLMPQVLVRFSSRHPRIGIRVEERSADEVESGILNGLFAFGLPEGCWKWNHCSKRNCSLRSRKARSIQPYTLIILPAEQVQISETTQKAIGRGETFGRSSRPETRESMIIGSGSMYSGDPQVEFLFLRATQPRPDGSRDYRLILGTPCKGCKDPLVYFNRAREAAQQLLQETSKKPGGKPTWSMAMIGSLQDYCSYIATFSQGIPRGVSQVGWIKACGWPKTGWK